MASIPKSNLGRYLLAVPIVMVVTFVSFLFMDEDTGSLMADIANPGFALPAALLAFTLYWVTRKTPSPELGIGLVVVFFLFALGELTWSLYVEVMGEDPSASLADLFWLVGYCVLVVLLFRVTRASGALQSKSMILVELAFWIIVSPILVYVLLTSLGSSDLTTLEVLTWNMYTILDAVILSLLIFLLWSFREGLLEDCWTIVAVAMIFMTVGDLLFTVYDAAGSYRIGSLPDVFYIGSYVLLTLGFGLLLVSRSRATAVAPVRMSIDEVDERRMLVPRTTYVIWASDSRKAYELMVKGLTAGLEGLIVSTKQPTSIRPTLGLKHTEVYWLTTSSGDNVIHPANTEALAEKVTRFMQKGPKTIALLDGFDAIKDHGDFKKALIALDGLKDVVAATGSRLVVSVDKRTLSGKEISLIEKCSVVIQ